MTAVSGRSVGVGDRAHPFLAPVLALLVGVAFTFSGTASFADGGTAGFGDPEETIEPSEPQPESEPQEQDPETAENAEQDPEPEHSENPEHHDPEAGPEDEDPEAGPEDESGPCPAVEDESDLGETEEGAEPTDGDADCGDTVEIEAGTDESSTDEPDAGPTEPDAGADAPADELGEEPGDELGEEPADGAGSDGPGPEPELQSDPEPDPEPATDPETSEPADTEPEEPAAFSGTSTTIDESDTPLTVTLSGPAAVFRVVGDGTILEDAALAPEDSGQQLNFSNQGACPAVISIVPAVGFDLGPYALRVRYDPGSGAETIPEAVIVGTRTELIPLLDVPAVEGGHAGFEKPLEFRLFTATEANSSNSVAMFTPGDSITMNLTFVIESTDCPAGSAD